MSKSQNQNYNHFGSSTNNQNRKINQNIDYLRGRFSQMQINDVIETGNNSQNVNRGHNSINNNTNPVQVNQTLGNNNATVFSENLGLNNTQNEMCDEEYNYCPGSKNFELHKGGLEFNDEFLSFPGEANNTTENAEDKIEKFDSSNYSSNTH